MTTTAAERVVLGRRWERVTEWPLMIAALVFLAAYAVPILNPDLPSWLLDSCRLLSWLTWGILVVDFAVRLFLAEKRLWYIIRHWYDVLVIVLPLLRPLRLLRRITLLSVLNRRAKMRLRGRVGIYVAGKPTVVIVVTAHQIAPPKSMMFGIGARPFGVEYG
jgi:voltage-gated potassium channel